MLIMKMKGGLGNQMFQYAAGRTLSLKTGLPLALDKRYYRREREHGYGLDAFKIAAVPLNEDDLPPLPRERPFAYAIWRLTGRGPKPFRQNGIGFDPAFEDISAPTWIEGYFQSERFFEKHVATIRDELTPVSSLDAENARWLSEIKAEPRAVSLHVRRGDYVRDAKVTARHGICTPEYYAGALAHVAEKTGADPIIYAFSDDPEWVRENLKLPAEIRVVGHNDPSRNVNDLCLMSACRHHIIANSSFSWWGAWLNPREDKIVTAPAQWFADPDYANPDILAAGWTAIDG